MEQREDFITRLVELRNKLSEKAEKKEINKSTALTLIEKSKVVFSNLYYEPGNTDAADLMHMVSIQLDEAAIDIMGSNTINGIKKACRALTTFLDHKEILYLDKNEEA